MAPSIFTADGDSISLGYPYSTPYTNYINIAAGPWQIYNAAVTGRTLATMYADAPSDVDPDFLSGVRDVLVIWGGTNDFVVNGSTPAAVYATLQNYCAARHAVGWKVLVVTMISRTGTNPVGGETIDADKNAYNALIRAGWSSFADGLIDIASLSPQLGADGAYANLTYFQADQTHPTTFSINNIEVPIIQAGINQFLNEGGTQSQMPPPAYIQSNDGFTSNPSLAVPFLSANSAGSLLVAYVGTNVTTLSVSDTRNGAWSNSLAQQNDGTITQFFWLLNCAQGANTVTASTTTGTVVELLIAEYSGVSAFDNSAQTISGSVTNPTESVVTSVAGDLLVCFTHNQSGITITAGTNMTAMRQDYANITALGDGIAGAAGSNSIGFTTASAVASIIGVAAFKPNVGGASQSWLTAALINSLRSTTRHRKKSI